MPWHTSGRLIHFFSAIYERKKCENLFFKFLSSIKVFILANVYNFNFLTYSQSDKSNALNRALRSYSDKHTFPGAYHEVVSRGLINFAFQTFFSRIKHKISRI